MNVSIKFEENENENVMDEDFYNLKELGELIKKACDSSISFNFEPKEKCIGVRDGRLAIGIALASLTVTSFQSLISLLQYWESKQPQYSLYITFKNRNRVREWRIKHASVSEIQALISQLQAENSIDYLEIRISKKR